MGLRRGPSGFEYGGLFTYQDWQHYVGQIARAWISDPAKRGWLDAREPMGAARWNLHRMTALAMTAFDDLAEARALAVLRDTYNDRSVGKIHAATAKVLLSLSQEEWEVMCGRMLDGYDELVNVGRSPWFARDIMHEPDVWPGWARTLLAEIEADNNTT